MVKIAFLSIISLIVALTITPFVIRFAKRINATDKPNKRKVHKMPTPTLGGLAIFISFLAGVFILQPSSPYHLSIVVGATILIILGIFDDLFEFTARFKFFIQLFVAILTVVWGGLQLEFINLPFGGQLDFGILSTIITVLWIVGITNAMNLIDGLDGLAGGVSSIALFTIAFMAMTIGDIYVFTIALILFWSTMGFLRYNFFPAKIFMGDTGSLFLGYMIAVLSLLGFKNVTVISFIIPLFILGVPIVDTFMAIARRFINQKPISAPDSAHLHHRLVQLGFTHKQTVLFIYSMSIMFNLAAVLFSMATAWGSVLIFLTAFIALQMIIEHLELINSDFKPLTNLMKVLFDEPSRKI